MPFVVVRSCYHYLRADDAQAAPLGRRLLEQILHDLGRLAAARLALDQADRLPQRLQ